MHGPESRVLIWRIWKALFLGLVYVIPPFGRVCYGYIFIDLGSHLL